MFDINNKLIITYKYINNDMTHNITSQHNSKPIVAHSVPFRYRYDDESIREL